MGMVARTAETWVGRVVRRLVRRWDIFEGVAMHASPEDAEAVRRHGEEVSARNSRLLALTLGIVNVAFWPSDLYNLRAEPEAIRELGHARAVESVICLVVYLSLRFIPIFRNRPRGILTITVSAACFALGYFFGRLGGPSTPWFHFTYLAMLMPLVYWLTIPERIGGTLLFGLCTIVGYFFMFPQHLADPFALVSISHMGFAICLSIGAGWVLDYLRREMFLMRLALARQAGELRDWNERLESRVQAQAAELRFLTGRLETARESERKAIARELHDELGQELTALRYALQAAKSRFERDPQGLRGNLAQLESLLARTSATTRNILVELRPRVLDDVGLSAAVEWLVERTRERAGLECTVQLPEGELPLAEEVAVAAFRIVQEGLTNIARHAQATEVQVAIAAREQQLEISIKDNGQGFVLSPNAPPRGMGLLGMRERVRALSGDLQIESEVGRGTAIAVTLPLLQATSEAA